MKIEISDESYEFLKNLISEIDTQDNRATASPYYYVVQERKERVIPFASPGSGDATLYFTEDGLVRSHELMDIYETKTEEEAIQKWGKNYPEEEPVVLDYYHDDAELSNVFFTEKAIKKHIEANHYHWREPRDYVKHAWRNPEMESLFKAVREIVK